MLIEKQLPTQTKGVGLTAIKSGSDLVRPEKIGGWQKLSIISFLGTARSIHPFAALDGERYRGAWH